MKKLDLTNVQEATDGFNRHPAGPYICKITSVEDIPDKEYLKVRFDIAEGEFAGYYSSGRDEHPDWGWYGKYTKSYKPTALPMFKRFCSAVSKSNGSYIFDGGAANSNEATLIGKKIGLMFREEEYYGNDGNLKTRLIVSSEFPVDKIGEQKTPSVKKVKETAPASAANDGFMKIPDGAEDTIPFG
jgi:hypothetical protein